MKKVSMGIALCLAAAAAGAQIPRMQAPSDTDLLAAYCSRFFINRSSGMARDIEQLTEENRPMARETIERDDRLVNRIKGYLLPRLQFIEITGIETAMAQSNADFRAAQSESQQCTARCTYPPTQLTCARNCLAQNPFSRFDKCKDASFLPY